MEKGIQKRERFIQMKRIKERSWKRKNLNWALKDGQNQYTEIKEGSHPHPTGQRREIFWVWGIPQPKAQKSKIQRMLREQQMADCEQNVIRDTQIKHTLGRQKILKGLGLVRENSKWVRAEWENKGVLLCFRKIHPTELAWKSRWREDQNLGKS